jgi:hypothetical protein
MTNIKIPSLLWLVVGTASESSTIVCETPEDFCAHALVQLHLHHRHHGPDSQLRLPGFNSRQRRERVFTIFTIRIKV